MSLLSRKCQPAMHDALIVGGGPAGSAAAALLSRSGFSVLLLDRAPFPRDKPCGEFLTPGCAPILRDLGIWPALQASGLRPIDSALICGARGAARYTPANREAAGWTMRRTDLDHVLLAHAVAAGADFRAGFRVRSLLRDGNRVVGVRAESAGRVIDFRSRLVLGADGAHSVVAREMRVVRTIGRLQRVALVSHWRGLPGSAIEMRAAAGAVCGLGPLSEDCANITLVVSSQEASRIAGRSADFLEETIRAAFPELSPRLERATLESIATIGCFGHTAARTVGDGVMLVGDAACFIDPFTGEGIYFALRGAQLAAEAAAKALAGGSVTAAALGDYESRREELRHRYRLCDLVQAIVRRPSVLDRFVAGMERNPRSRARLMSILGDLRPAKDALDPRLIADLLLPG